jgi:hypothetical protein
MGYSQPISLLPSSGYAGNGIGLPVLVGRNDTLDLSLVVTGAPASASVSVTLETSAFAVREGCAHSITWRQLGAAIELTGLGSTSVSVSGADVFVRARYAVSLPSDVSAMALSLGGRASCALVPSAARSGASVGPVIDLAQYHGGRFAALVSAAPGGGETLALTIERSSDGVSGWTTAATFATISAAGEYAVESADLDQYVRTRWVPSGAGSWTFGVTGTTSLIFARSRDRSGLGIRSAAIPGVTSAVYLAAFEAATDTMKGDFTAFVLPLRGWGADTRRACTALADWHLLTNQGEEPQGGIYRTLFDEWSLWLANVGGRVPGAAGRRIRPADVVDSTPPERDGTRAAYKFASDPPRQSGSRRLVW